MAVKRMRSTRRVSSIMAKPAGRAARPKRRHIFRTRRRFGWGWIRHLPLLWLGALAVCGFLFYFFVGSGYFSVRTVSASNLSQRELDEVNARCQCVGDNIFTLRADDIKQRLEAIPTLNVVRVYTRLPNLVIVEATHKHPVAIWRTPEAAYAVTSDGEVLQVWRKPFPRHLWRVPVFDEGYDSSVKKGHRLLVGEHISREPLAMALNLRDRIPTDLRVQVRRYYYRPFLGLTLVGRAGWWALFGMDYSPTLDTRITALRGVLAADPPYIGPGDCISLVDLNNVYKRHDHRCGT